jgi:hypothetical protein
MTTGMGMIITTIMIVDTITIMRMIINTSITSMGIIMI